MRYSALRTLAVNGLRLNAAPTGVGRYIEQLARQWSRMQVPFDRILFLSPRSADVNVSGAELLHTSTISRWPRRLVVAWEQATLPRAARKAAILFCPGYIAPVAYGGPLVVPNHGLSSSYRSRSASGRIRCFG